ncbi:MAG: hypothetical protein U9O98_04270 [Asgard group archaeon]|nr:hypothetical protein [Asgard group archaeon]
MSSHHINDQWVLNRISKESKSFTEWIDGLMDLVEKEVEGNSEALAEIKKAKKDLPDMMEVEQIIQSTQEKLATIPKKLAHFGNIGGFLSNLGTNIMDTINQQMAKTSQKVSDIYGFDIDFITGKRKTLSEALYDVTKERGIHLDGILYLIQSLPDFESFLYSTSAGKYYRDHTEHQLRVAVLGDFLLEQDLGVGTLLNQVADLTELDKTLLKEEIWWTMGLIHDIGYPLQKMTKSINYALLNQILKCYPMLDLEIVPFEIMLKTKKNDPYLELLEEGLSKEAKKLIRIGASKNLDTIPQPETLQFISTSNGHDEYHHQSPINLDHGVIGALALLRSIGSIDYIKDNKDELEGYIKAAQAIAVHNFKDRLHDFTFENNPLAFLLVLIDEMQEWGRPIPLQIRDSYFTTEMKKITLLDEIILTISDVEWLMEYRKMEAKKITNFNFKLFCDSKNNAFKRLRHGKEFPETRIVLQDYFVDEQTSDSSKSEMIEKTMQAIIREAKTEKETPEKKKKKKTTNKTDAIDTPPQKKVPSKKNDQLQAEFYIVI